MAYVRSALLIAMQVSVLASTYVAGPVDTSLLSLVGDAALTPLLLIVIYREGADRARSPFFLGGLVLSISGATLTIVGGQGARDIQGIGWLVTPAVPLAVALYFLLSARASLRIPSDAALAQSMLVGGWAPSPSARSCRGAPPASASVRCMTPHSWCCSG